MDREINLMSEFELQKALNQPRAYDVGPREERAINKEIGWRHQERIAAAQAHENEFRSAGLDDGFSVDITQGIPDPIADPLPDPVVNHVGTVTTGEFQPVPLPGDDPIPPEIITPEDSPLDVVPYKNPNNISTSTSYVDDGITVRFEVDFNSEFNDKFNSEFNSEFNTR